MTKLRVLDLFSGIGGFALGLERAGMQTVAFCEIEDYPRRVLRKHWPKVPIYDDVRTLTATRLADDGIGVDVICGGFPCQDISIAGKGAGLAGERSGLWSEYARLVGELRPRYVIVENVAALLHRGIGDVLGDLAALGYDAEWHCIPAVAVGAPHRRDRVWIVSYPNGGLCNRIGDDAAHGGEVPPQGLERVVCGSGRGKNMAYTNGARLEGWLLDWLGSGQRTAMASSRSIPGDWLAEPGMGRVANGVPARVDRLKGLGNAVVPQVVELIGRAILATEITADSRARTSSVAPGLFCRSSSRPAPVLKSASHLP